MADDNFDNWEDDDGTGGDYVDDGTGGGGGDGGYDDEGEAEFDDGAGGAEGGAEDGGEALYDDQGNLIYAGEDAEGDAEADGDAGEHHDNGEGADFDDGGDGGDQSYDQDDGGEGGEMGEAEDDGGYPAVIDEGDEDAAAAEEEEEAGVDPVQEARMAALDAARQKALMNIRSMSAFKPAVATTTPSAFGLGGAAAPQSSQSSFSAFAAPQRGSSAFHSPAPSAFSPPPASSAAAASAKAERPKTAREKKKELKEQKLAAKLQAQQQQADASGMSGGRSNSRSIVPISSAFSNGGASTSKEQAKLDRAARFASTTAAALAAPSSSPSAFGSHSPNFSPSPSPEFGAPPAFIGGRGGASAGRSTASLMASAMGGASDDLNAGGEEDLFGRQAEHYTPIVGQCLQMCPTEEQQARQESRDLSYFEIIPGTGSKDHGDVPLVNPSAAVKKYKRAAAAQTLHAKDVRPPHILQQTMAYLISKIMDRQDSPDPPPLPPFLVVYRFCSDRMRALRQDFACQGLKDAGAVSCYETMVRFHILTLFECGEINNLEKFDPTPNMEKLSQTLTSLRHMYFDNYAGLNQGRTPFPTPNEAEMHSYRLLVDLDRRFGTLYEELDKFSPDIKSAPIIQFCVQVYNAFRENNWVRFFALARRAPYLHAVLLQGYFNKVRTRALEVIAGGCYKSYPFDAFQSLLAFESPRHALDFLNYHGIELDPKNSPGVIQFKTRGRGAFQMPEAGAAPLPFRNSWRIVGPKRPKLVSQAVQAAIGRGEGLGLESFIPGGALRSTAAAAGTNNKLARAVKQQQQLQSVDASMDGGAFAAMGSSSSSSAFGAQQFNTLSRSAASSSNLQSAFSSGHSAFAPSSAASFSAANNSAFALPAAGSLDGSKPGGAPKLNRTATGAATAALASSAASIAAAAAAAASSAAASTAASGSSLNAKAAPFVPKSAPSVSLPASSSSAFNAGTAPAFGVSAFAPSSSSAANVGFASSGSAVFGGSSSSVSFGTFGSDTKSVPPPLNVVSSKASAVPTPPLSARGFTPPALQVPTFGATTAAGSSALPSPRAPLEAGQQQTEHIAGFQLTALPAQPSTPRATVPATNAAASAAPPATAVAGLSRSHAVASSSLAMPPPHPRPPLASSTRSAAGSGFSANDRADSSLMVDVPRHTPSVIVSYKRQQPLPPPRSPSPEQAEQMFLAALRTYRTSLLRKGLRSWHASSLERLSIRAANERAQRALEKRAEIFVQTKFFLRWHEVMREHQEAQIRFNQAQENLHAPVMIVSPLRRLTAAQPQQLLLTSGSSTPSRSTALVRSGASPSPSPSHASLASGVVSSGLLSPYGKLERLGIHVAVVPSLADQDAEAEAEADEEQLATEEDAAALEQEQEEDDDPASGQLDFDAAADDDEQEAAGAEHDGPDAAEVDDPTDADYVPAAEGEEEEEEAEGAEEEEEGEDAEAGSADAADDPASSAMDDFVRSLSDVTRHRDDFETETATLRGRLSDGSSVIVETECEDMPNDTRGIVLKCNMRVEAAATALGAAAAAASSDPSAADSCHYCCDVRLNCGDKNSEVDSASLIRWLRAKSLLVGSSSAQSDQLCSLLSALFDTCEFADAALGDTLEHAEQQIEAFEQQGEEQDGEEGEHNENDENGEQEDGDDEEADADADADADEQEEGEEAEADTGLAPMDMSDDPLAAAAHASHAHRLIHGSPARVGRNAGIVRMPLTPLSASAATKSPAFVPRVSLLFTSPYTPSRSPAASTGASGSHKRSRQAIEVDAFLDSLMSPGSRGLPQAPAPTPATTGASARRGAGAQNQPAATFDSSHVPLLYDDDSASEGAGLDGERSYGFGARQSGAAPSSATRAKLFHTPSTQAARAVFSPPSQQQQQQGASSSPYLNPTFAVGAALDAAASAASPASYLRPRLSFGNGNSRFHSPHIRDAAAASAHTPSSSSSSARVARAGDLLQRVSAEIKQSSKLDQLMQQLEYRYAAQL